MDASPTKVKRLFDLKKYYLPYMISGLQVRQDSNSGNSARFCMSNNDSNKYDRA